MDKPAKTPSQILTAAEAAALLDLDQGTLQRMRWQGMGPPFKRHRGRIWYRHTELAAWSKSRQQGCTIKRSAFRLRILAGMLALLALLLALNLCKRPLFVWNASSSVAVGLYRVTLGLPRPGGIVIIRLPQPAARIAEDRGYLSGSAYLLKPVVAVAGDRVCRFGASIFVRRRFAALAHAKDQLVRRLPLWQGCRTLGADELFLLADHPDSFDSRYFGPIDGGQVAGIAILIWPAHAT